MTVERIDPATGDAGSPTVEWMLGLVMQHVARMTDSHIYRGLDAKTVAYMRRMVDKNPDLRPIFARAADLRSVAREKSATRRPQYVYFIQNEATLAVKIGVAADPVSRLATLQTGSDGKLSIIGVLPGGRALERELHRRFSYARLSGEWFEPAPEILDLAEGVSSL